MFRQLGLSKVVHGSLMDIGSEGWLKRFLLVLIEHTVQFVAWLQNSHCVHTGHHDMTDQCMFCKISAHIMYVLMLYSLG